VVFVRYFLSSLLYSRNDREALIPVGNRGTQIKIRTILSDLLYGFLQNTTVSILARPRFMRLNEFLFVLVIRTMGVLNFQNVRLTGENDFVRNYLLARDDSNFLVLDVGANVGEFAELVLASTNSINVISFEPNPVPFGELARKCEKYGPRLEAVKMAISDFSGPVDLIVDDSRPFGGFSTLHSEIHSESDPTIRRIETPATSIDHFFENRRIPEIALLKIDVEGHEKKVLIGAKELINKSQPHAILFEFNYMHIHSNTTLTDLMALIGGDYDFFRLLPKGNLYPLKDKHMWLREIYAFQNIVCLLRIED